MECSVDGCTNRAKYKATGWCQTHYHRNYRTGSIADPVYGDEVNSAGGYRVCHARIRAKWGPASRHPCVMCGDPAREYAYDGTDPSERTGLLEVQGKQYPVAWSRWPEFYMPLCYPCHRLRDRSAWAVRRTHCKHGHEMTAENTYTRPSRPGTKECRECKRTEARERKRRTRRKK